MSRIHGFTKICLCVTLSQISGPNGSRVPLLANENVADTQDSVRLPRCLLQRKCADFSKAVQKPKAFLGRTAMMGGLLLTSAVGLHRFPPSKIRPGNRGDFMYEVGNKSETPAQNDTERSGKVQSSLSKVGDSPPIYYRPEDYPHYAYCHDDLDFGRIPDGEITRNAFSNGASQNSEDSNDSLSWLSRVVKVVSFTRHGSRTQDNQWPVGGCWANDSVKYSAACDGHRRSLAALRDVAIFQPLHQELLSRIRGAWSSSASDTEKLAGSSTTCPPGILTRGGFRQHMNNGRRFFAA